jgi:DNA-nicking Smr family endonuclease
MNKYLRPIDAEIDLHQMTRDEARQKVEALLIEAESLGYKKIRIITGKGIHSENGRGVLSTYVKELLDLKGYDYNLAKYDEGGGGAIDVSL